jgi:NADP-dependent 3-hydroxy acid dehydrogenase YdfG
MLLTPKSGDANGLESVWNWVGIHPGAVETEFSEVRKGDTEKAANVYRVWAFAPEDIADIIHFVVSRPYHVNIADLIVCQLHKRQQRFKKIFKIDF